MKQISLILSLSFLVNYAYSQNYESLFGSESTQWNMTIGNLWGTGSTEHHIIGDTVIGNNNYKIINGYEGLDEIRGFIRQDSLHEKAWYRNNQNDDEQLIMDLTLSIGDSLFIQGVWNSNPGYYIVDSIFTESNRKHIQFDLRLNFVNDDKFTLIEGVVSNMGFRYQDNDYINGLPTILLCAFKNEEKVYGEGECIYTTTKEESTLGGLSIYPNPFTSHLTLTLNKPISEGQIEIIDQLGLMRYRKLGRFSENESINLSELSNGIYFVVFRDFSNQRTQTNRLVKVTNK